ncbi:putative RNA methyltransferase [Ktedonospora formicarum]|uniref:23S rRNA (Guanine(745)-N(1))-methyltransferase n=1 Tax=Ktedonospora formicarum TaxID=2778364 RepID=A0A8J3MTL1_9CHLR|nr:methyltransferase domain-containing protein [Ktedonospora formicarum]GHO44495.1 23S rRNA (guanine(745)-N(1))-methyltransferase [Ktedonospora formicarum]
MTIKTCALNLLTCPLCQGSFHVEARSLLCEQRHTFDIAREGYLYLLRKKASGDTKEMLEARRAFLERGYYAPLAQRLTELLMARLRERSVENASPFTILDAGCGNGYYLGYLLAQLEANSYTCALGFDISKDAIRMAAKSYPQAQFIVANLKEHLPLRDASVQTILNVFAPRNISEFARVLVSQGELLIVIPGEHHLAQARAELGLLNLEENKRQHVLSQVTANFDLLEQHDVAYTLDLDQEALRQLVRMTPNYWHMTDAIEERLSAIERQPCDVEFHCLLLRKK